MIDKDEWHKAFKELYPLASLPHREFLENLEEWKQMHPDIVKEIDNRKVTSPNFSKSEIRRYIRDYKLGK